MGCLQLLFVHYSFHFQLPDPSLRCRIHLPGSLFNRRNIFRAAGNIFGCTRTTEEIGWRSWRWEIQGMINRSNMAEQLKEYQIRPKYVWASLSLVSSTPNRNSSRADVAMFVVWELLVVAFLVFSGVSLYLMHLKLGIALLGISLLLVVSLKITKQTMLAREKKRRMLLPLSM